MLLRVDLEKRTSADGFFTRKELSRCLRLDDLDGVEYDFVQAFPNIEHLWASSELSKTQWIRVGDDFGMMFGRLFSGFCRTQSSKMHLTVLVFILQFGYCVVASSIECFYLACDSKVGVSGQNRVAGVGSRF